ncbi:MAG: PucR family transcriptional regulator, partial [Clostridium sp.]
TIENSVIHQDEYILSISKGRTVIILINNKYIKKRIKDIWNKVKVVNTFGGLGRPSYIVNRSFMDSLFTIEFGRKIFSDEDFINYDRVSLFNGFEDNKSNVEIIKIMDNISCSQNGEELMETIITLMENNGERSKTAEVLHIHRNTLNYRLTKIEEITGLIFNNYIDLYNYIALYILKKINSK